MSKSWYRQKKYDVSQHNYAKQVTANFDFPKKIYIVDSTLRKVLYTPGLYGKITPDDYVEVANIMDEIGVSQIYINNPRTKEAFDCCKAVGEQRHKFKFNVSIAFLVTKAWKAGVDKAIEVNADCAEYECKSTEKEIKSLGLDEEKVIARLREALDYGKRQGISVSAGFEDSTRADFNFLIRLANESIKHGAEKLNFYDSYGCASPDALRYFFKEIRRNLIKDVPVIVHAHNIFGLASASAVAAVTAGANPDVAVNGVGESCGLASLEEVVLALELLYGISTGIRLEKLTEYSQIVKEKTMRAGIDVSSFKPIVGDYAFLYEIEGWITEYLKEPSNPNPFVPELVGQKRQFVWGANTFGGYNFGVTATKAELDKLGLKYTDEDIDKIHAIIKERLAKKTRPPIWLTELEVAQICVEVVKNTLTPKRA